MQLTTTPLHQAAAEALAGLTPVVVVNRRADVAAELLQGPPDRPFPTIHDDPGQAPRTLLRKAVRSANERVRGTHGTGDDAGRTVYGSVRFVASEDAAAGADSVVAALRRQGDVGVRAYGPVSFVADPDRIAARTTFAADDSGATLARVRPPQQLADVVVERIGRSQGRPGVPDLTQLQQLPAGAASDAVRGWLLSADLAHSDGYIEAQVRRLAPQDVLAAVIDLRDDAAIERRTMIDPGAVPDADSVQHLRGQLDRLGVSSWTVATGR
jgi:hypothetical protein